MDTVEKQQFQEEFSGCEAIVRRFRSDHREDLIPCMQAIQDEQGHMSEESIAAIGRYFGLPATKVYGIATFYDYFTFTPRQGELIRICNGTSCHMHGSGKLAREVEKAAQQIGQKNRTRITVKLCECQGACNAGPIMQINDVIITRAIPSEVRNYIQRGISVEGGAGL